tara:strand:+ start:7088 stop:7681 length:594 start_codon:yes stop_codon:yes gene_type:complete
MTDAAACYGLVLAGGKSRRMGQDKASLAHGGKSQLEFAFDLLAGTTDKQFVSTNEAQRDDALRARFPQIVDHYADIGPIAGILSALETYPQVDWLVVACDLPNLDETTLGELLSKASPDKPFTAFRSSRDGLPEPLCAVYRANSAAILRRFVEEGIHCPRKVLLRSDTHLLDLPQPAALDNINTRDDLARSILKAAG